MCHILKEDHCITECTHHLSVYYYWVTGSSVCIYLHVKQHSIRVQVNPKHAIREEWISALKVPFCTLSILDVTHTFSYTHTQTSTSPLGSG